MSYNADTLKKLYQKECLERRKINLVRLRKEIAELSPTEFSKQIGIQKSNLSSLENGDRDLSLFNIQAYKSYFLERYKLNISTDYLLGYTSVIENKGMNISDDLGLSGKSIEVLKSWRKLKENPERFAVAYGATDIDTLNLLLEDYHYLQSNANKKGLYAGFSIFHYIGNYIFSERFKRCPTETIKYEHKSTNPEIGNSLDDLNIGDVVKVNGNEHTILSLHAYDKCNLKADSDKLAIYNMQDSEEIYSITFQDMLKAYSKENIIKIIDRVKKRIQGSDD